jgi:hypothetical protein
VLAVVLLVGLIGWYAYVAGSRVDVDPETGCPTIGPLGITAILFDRTDPINEKQKLSIKNKLDVVRDNTKKFEEVDAYSLEAQGDDLVMPLLRICDPGRGSGANPLISNPTLLEERWKKQFDAPLQEWEDSMSKGGGSKTSAIFEAIQSISLQSFQKSTLKNNAPRKLIIISDLLQFTKTLDFYKGDLNYESFQRTSEARRLHTNLNGVDVYVMIIPRSNRLDRLLPFWTKWFIDQGASNFRSSPVEG